jgi:hypothetical protein
MIFSYPYWLQLIGMGCSSMIGGPDQPEPDWRGAGREAETLDYLNDIIRELKQLADKRSSLPTRVDIGRCRRFSARRW